jgi:hypothetical protein
MAITRQLILVVTVLTSVAALGGERQEPAFSRIEVVDATTPFWNFWDAAQGKSTEERIPMFFEMVVSAHPELFDANVLQAAAVVGDVKQELARARVRAYLDDVVPYIPKMRQLSANIDSSFQAYANDFTDTFPDFAPKSRVYFTVAMFSFDGGTRPVGGKIALLFGIDGIARFQGSDANLKILFDHELFHQYHDQIAPELTDDDAPLWMALWEEGLATYVSQRMNPGSSVAQVLMFPPDLAGHAQPKLRALAQELMANLDSKEAAEYASFFYVRNDRPDIPPRSGYYVGYLVAAALGSNRTLQQLAALRGPELKTAVALELNHLAGDP